MRLARAGLCRRGSSGRDRVDHPPGAHDDRANAVAGVVHARVRARLEIWGGGYAIDDTVSRERAAEWLEGQVRVGGGAFFP